MSYNNNDMDAKITLSFNEDVIRKAKRFANENNISLSRLAEFLLSKVTSSTYKSLDDLPVSDWVQMVSEGEVQYVRKPHTNKQLRKEYHNRKK